MKVCYSFTYVFFFPGICVPPEFICDNTNDCGNMYDESSCEDYQKYSPMCTFEDEQCDWTQESQQDDIGNVFFQVVVFHYTYMYM